MVKLAKQPLGHEETGLVEVSANTLGDCLLL